MGGNEAVERERMGVEDHGVGAVGAVRVGVMEMAVLVQVVQVGGVCWRVVP